MHNKRRVLVVDDSLIDRTLLVHILNHDPRLEVIGTASNGTGAIASNLRLGPDVIVMDVTMADMDGLQTTARIMHTNPVPIVICTGLHPTDPEMSFKAIEAGALALVAKPEGPGHRDHATAAHELAETVALMSEVKVIRRWRPALAARAGWEKAAPWPESRGPGLVAIGASTGGPPVLQTILAKLSPRFPLPILIVQHIAPGFLSGMASWLQRATSLPVSVAQHGESPKPGHVYLAPDHRHMGVGALGQIALTETAEGSAHCPSVAHLFRTLAGSSFAAQSVGIILTGMGSDGAEELKALRGRGALTLAQNAETSVVHGMPGEAIRLGGATHVLAPEEIALLLLEFARSKPARWAE